jgi:hypothetical protein
MDDRRFESWYELGIFLLSTASRLALGPTQPPIQWVTWALSLGIKRPGREADHSPPTSAEIKNAWSYTSTAQFAFVAWCLVKKAQGQLYLLHILRSFIQVLVVFVFPTFLSNQHFAWGFCFRYTCCVLHSVPLILLSVCPIFVLELTSFIALCMWNVTWKLSLYSIKQHAMKIMDWRYNSTHF